MAAEWPCAIGFTRPGRTATGSDRKPDESGIESIQSDRRGPGGSALVPTAVEADAGAAVTKPTGSAFAGVKDESCTSGIDT